jgi:hypothetical protein
MTREERREREREREKEREREREREKNQRSWQYLRVTCLWTDRVYIIIQQGQANNSFEIDAQTITSENEESGKHQEGRGCRVM